MKKWLQWLRSQDRHFWFIVALTLIGALLRFWNLENSQQFLGDQGRDALVVSKIFTEGDLLFTGPVTSIGNMYLGPAYYYFMLPFLWLTYPSPMGPIVAVALLGVITIPVLFRVGAEILNKRAALIAAFFYTFGPSVIAHTRFSWNPNPAPIVTLILILGIYRAITKNSWYWVLVFGMMSLLLQLHYVSLLMGGVIAIFWLWELFRIIKSKKIKKNFIPASLISGLVLFASMIPLVLFDWKHGWRNLIALKNIFVKEEAFSVVRASYFDIVRNFFIDLFQRFNLVFYEIWFGSGSIKNNWLILISLLSLIYLLFFFWKLRKKQLLGFLILLVTLVISVFGLAFYQHEIYLHYVTFLFPISFLLLGAVFDRLLFINPLFASIIILIFSQYFAFSAVRRINFDDAGTPIYEIRQTAEQIVSELSDDESYSIALLSGTKDILGQNYLYFLNTTGRPPIEESRRGFNDVLFIIDEEHKEEEVLQVPIYEIEVFKNWQIDKTINIPEGPTVTVVRKAKRVE